MRQNNQKLNTRDVLQNIQSLGTCQTLTGGDQRQSSDEGDDRVTELTRQLEQCREQL